MTSWTAWLVAGFILGAFVYAIYSLIAKKPGGLYSSAFIHIVLGIWLFPSVGLYVLGLAILELTAAIIMNIKAMS